MQFLVSDYPECLSSFAGAALLKSIAMSPELHKYIVKGGVVPSLVSLRDSKCMVCFKLVQGLGFRVHGMLQTSSGFRV